MIAKNNKDPLHGLTLEAILTSLEEHYGWDGLSQKINIRCFTNEPSIKSSLKFLRKTPWARKKVEALYLATQNSIWK
ncbi:MAG: VF530 family DNA-binding protein [Cycloclasticus sp.]